MKAMAMAIGYGAGFISCVFTVRFFTGFANVGFEKFFFALIGVMFQSAQLFTVVAGVRLRQRGEKVFSVLMFAVFAVLFFLSIVATVGSLSGNFGKQLRTGKAGDAEWQRLQSEISKLQDDKKILNQRIDEGIRKNLISTVVKPDKAKVQAIDERLEKLRFKSDSYEFESDDEMMYSAIASFFGADSESDRIRLILYLICAVMIDLTASLSLTLGSVLGPKPVSNRLVPSPSAVDMWEYIREKGGIKRRQLLASKRRDGANEYNKDLAELISLGLLKLDDSAKFESDYVYDIRKKA
jgi:hypothetical protein